MRRSDARPDGVPHRRGIGAVALAAGDGERGGDPGRGAQRRGDGVAGGRVDVAGGGAERAAPVTGRDGSGPPIGMRHDARCGTAVGVPRRAASRGARSAGGTGGRAARTVSSTASRRRRAPCRRTSAGRQPGRAEVHQHRAAGRRRRRRRRRRRSASPAPSPGRRPRASTTMRASTSPPSVTTAAAPRQVHDPLGRRRDRRSRRSPGAGARASLSRMPYGPLDVVAAVAVDGDAGHDRARSTRRAAAPRRATSRTSASTARPGRRRRRRARRRAPPRRAPSPAGPSPTTATS